MFRPTLSDMYEAALFEADLRFGQLTIRAKYGKPDDALVRQRAETFEIMAEMYATFATFPDETRKFYADLKKRHRA